ncbi:hypothetical protein F1559_003379 [Cyanidiococcus yangmingshanensis]|uniref:Uncharacterized protein n=1 Tax=Cyanidiococcus yangmingshanensis TaxID=2690220 RepID=A0A7J7IL12_9RHOD|nr:hypothetical protein F1559_003379 [Cyanidiococcus yangmingshanensis]
MTAEQCTRAVLGTLSREVLVRIAVYLQPDEVEALWSAAEAGACNSSSSRLEQFCAATLRCRYGSGYAQSLFQAYSRLQDASRSSMSLRPWSWRLALYGVYLSHRWLFGICFRANMTQSDVSSMIWSTELPDPETMRPAVAANHPRTRLTVQRFDQRAIQSIGDGALLAVVLSSSHRAAEYERSNAEYALVVTPHRLLWFAAESSSCSDLRLDTERSLFLTTPLLLTAAISDDHRLLALGRRGCLLEIRDLLNWGIVAEGRLPVRISKRDDFCCLDCDGGMVAAGTTSGRLLIFDCNSALHRGEQTTIMRLKPIRMELDTSGTPLSHVRLCRSREERRCPDLVVVTTKHQLRIYYLRLGLFIFQRDFERPICSVQAARSRTCVYIASGGTYAATLGRPSIMNENDQLTCVAVDHDGNVAGGWSSGHVTFWPARGRLVGVALTYHDRHLDLRAWQNARRIHRRDLAADAVELEDNPSSAWEWSRSPIRSIYVDRDRVISASAAGVIEVFAHRQSPSTTADSCNTPLIENAILRWQYCRTAWVSLPNLQGEILHLGAGERTILGGLCGDRASVQQMPLVLIRIASFSHEASEQVPNAKDDGQAGNGSRLELRTALPGEEQCWLPPADIVRAFWLMESSPE